MGNRCSESLIQKPKEYTTSSREVTNDAHLIRFEDLSCKSQDCIRRSSPNFNNRTHTQTATISLDSSHQHQSNSQLETTFNNSPKIPVLSNTSSPAVKHQQNQKLQSVTIAPTTSKTITETKHLVLLPFDVPNLGHQIHQPPPTKINTGTPTTSHSFAWKSNPKHPNSIFDDC
ncbi:hypothetical protein Droror1_Dr00024913 [Drosera rotundifolia]